MSLFQDEKTEEQLRKEAEEQAAIQAELEAKRLIEERKMAIAKEKRDIAEQQLRTEQLENSAITIANMKQALWDRCLEDKAKEDVR